eukprot:12874093-Prorocentrum_lima.AAC.1
MASFCTAMLGVLCLPMCTPSSSSGTRLVEAGGCNRLHRGALATDSPEMPEPPQQGGDLDDIYTVGSIDNHIGTCETADTLCGLTEDDICWLQEGVVVPKRGRLNDRGLAKEKLRKKQQH